MGPRFRGDDAKLGAATGLDLIRL